MKTLLFCLVICITSIQSPAQPPATRLKYKPPGNVQQNYSQPAAPPNGQATNRVIKAYPLVQQVTEKLNGTLNAAIGGVSRTLIQIALPPFTAEWHYSFCARRDGTSQQNLQLGIQLTGIVSNLIPGMAPFTGIEKSLLSSIITPPGSLGVNVYLLDAANANAFKNKQPFSYILEGSITSATQALMTIRNLTQGTYYLAIDNYNVRSAVLVDIEAVAIQSFVTHGMPIRNN